MARATKRTSMLLGALAIVFLCIIIILCIVPKDSPQHADLGSGRSRSHPDIFTGTSTSTASTSTTTPTTTTAATTTPTTAASVTTSSTTSDATSLPTSEDTVGITTTDSATDGSSSKPTSESSTASTPSESTSHLATDESTTVSTIIESTDESTTVSTIMESTDESTTVSTSDDLDTDESTTVSTTGESTTAYSAAATPSTPPLAENASVCETPACKTVASNMLAMMDHNQGVSPCKDFYQYACGGVMDYPFLHPRQPGIIAEGMIKDQLDEPDYNDAVMSKMRKFYDSCLDVDQYAIKKWTQPIKKLFDDYNFKFQEAAILVGEDFSFNLTTTLVNMMKNDFTPFFNMELEVDRSSNTAFTLNLHPVVPGSRFSEDLARKVCLEEHHKDLTAIFKNMGSYDVEEAYKDFMECVRKGDGLEARLTRMEEAVKQLGLMDDMDKNYSSNLLPQTIDKTRDFLIDLADVLPNIPELKQHLANRNYDPVSIENLPEGIAWETVVEELIHPNEVKRTVVNTYMEDTLGQMAQKIEDYYERDQAVMNNILLMLWSERLYTDFVKPVGASVGEKEYCLRTTVALMEDAASYLYLDALSQEEIDARNEQINSIAENVQRAGKRTLQRYSKDEKITDKLDHMLKEVMTVNIQDAQDTADINTQQVNFTSDFLQNSLQLLTNRRTLMYQIIQDDEDPNYVWRVFMQPYDPFGVHNYVMSRIMIPYAAQEPSSVFKNIPDYLNYAGIGHMISHLVWHGYDTSGLQFQPEDFATLPESHKFTSLSQDLLKQFQAEQSYKNPNGLAANFSMSLLSWNELVSDSRATELAWEAYLIRNETKPTDVPALVGTFTSPTARRRRRSLSTPGHQPSVDSIEKPLPWLGLSPIQLYYLHWAQHHCSASSEISMLEVMEGEQPPARMRVNLVLQNEPLFQKAFNCPPA